MKTLRIFYLEGCPYCAHARRAMAELLAEPDFAVLYFDNSAISQLADRGVALL